MTTVAGRLDKLRTPEGQCFLQQWIWNNAYLSELCVPWTWSGRPRGWWFQNHGQLIYGRYIDTSMTAVEEFQRQTSAPVVLHTLLYFSHSYAAHGFCKSFLFSTSILTLLHMLNQLIHLCLFTEGNWRVLQFKQDGKSWRNLNYLGKDWGKCLTYIQKNHTLYAMVWNINTTQICLLLSAIFSVFTAAQWC